MCYILKISREYDVTLNRELTANEIIYYLPYAFDEKISNDK